MSVAEMSHNHDCETDRQGRARRVVLACEALLWRAISCGGRSLVVACCCPEGCPDVLPPFVQRDRHLAGYEISEPALKGRYFLVLGAGLARRHGHKAACQRISER